jgi:hypothetical protein
MTAEEIIEGNKLIAEFMGGVYFEAWQNKDYHHPEPHYYFKDREYISQKVKIILYYNDRWDELMPAFIKLSQLGYYYRIYYTENSSGGLYTSEESKIKITSGYKEFAYEIIISDNDIWDDDDKQYISHVCQIRRIEYDAIKDEMQNIKVISEINEIEVAFQAIVKFIKYYKLIKKNG